MHAIDRKRNNCGADRNGEERDQIPTHRDPPAHTAPRKINNTGATGKSSGDQKGAKTDPEHPSEESVQRQVER